eukprot:TRINITY_DN43199_c0_g1_i1.p1 TRINITY_DN43199_c0_g1~~TRINITY_DN43199_c0_g1_i1.p1  ORF type:complete len:885 (+),score=157.15 TRINITY_DN43199_c0_g1_i1:21-2675(+)
MQTLPPQAFSHIHMHPEGPRMAGPCTSPGLVSSQRALQALPSAHAALLQHEPSTHPVAHAVASLAAHEAVHLASHPASQPSSTHLQYSQSPHSFPAAHPSSTQQPHPASPHNQAAAHAWASLAAHETAHLANQPIGPAPHPSTNTAAHSATMPASHPAAVHPAFHPGAQAATHPAAHAAASLAAHEAANFASTHAASGSSPTAKRPAPHPELDHRDHELVHRLHERKLHEEHAAQAASLAKAASAASRSKSPHIGDRGKLSPHAVAHAPPSSAAASHADHVASATASAVALAASAAHGGLVPAAPHMWPELEPEALSQEVAAREVELRVLRKELEARNRETASLLDQIRDVEMKLDNASGLVASHSAKVEASAGSKHAVLEASAKLIDSQVAGLKKRLALMDWELHEKDEEVANLREATRHGTQQLSAKEQELHALQHRHNVQDSQVAKLRKDSSILHKHLAIDEWRHTVEAQIEQEEQDAALVRQRRENQRQIEVVDEEISTLKSYIDRMDHKINHSAGEIERQKQQLKSLAMEERLCASAARLGHETADELKKGHLEEQRQLEARLHDEMLKKTNLLEHVKAYGMVEADAAYYQKQLAALTSCVREVSRALHEPPLPTDRHAVDAAMESFQRTMKQHGVLLPPIVRAGANEHLIGRSLTVRCELSDGGQLCVREKTGLTKLADFLQKHGLTKHGVGTPAPQAAGAVGHPATANHAMTTAVHSLPPSTHSLAVEHTLHPAYATVQALAVHPASAASLPPGHPASPHLTHAATLPPGHPAHLALGHPPHVTSPLQSHPFEHPAYSTQIPPGLPAHATLGNPFHATSGDRAAVAAHAQHAANIAHSLAQAHPAAAHAAAYTAASARHTQGTHEIVHHAGGASMAV